MCGKISRKDERDNIYRVKVTTVGSVVANRTKLLRKRSTNNTKGCLNFGEY